LLRAPDDVLHSSKPVIRVSSDGTDSVSVRKPLLPLERF